VKASINGRLATLELVKKPKVQEEQLTVEDRLLFFVHSLDCVRQCLEAGEVIQHKGQRGRDDFYDAVWCPSCGEAEWYMVTDTIKHMAQDIGWTSSALSAHGNKYHEHEANTLEELRWWLDHLEGIVYEDE
jgi:hypothetical protein